MSDATATVTFKCAKCPRTFKLQEFFERHKLVHDLKRKHACQLCGSVFGAAKGLEDHMKVHPEEKEQHEEKPMEKVGFVQAPTLDSNQVSIVDCSQDSIVECIPVSNADTVQGSEADGVQGSKVESIQGSKAFPDSHGVSSQVKETGSSTASKSSLQASSSKIGNGSSATTGTGSYEILDSFPEVTDVAEAVPNGLTKCKICTREFAGLTSLKRHILIHTRRVQHSCDVCGFVFAKKGYLLDHMRKHTGEISPLCEVCGQTFNTSIKLKEHFKIHKNFNILTSIANPYKCHICTFTCPKAPILGKHLVVIHSKTVYKCDICKATFGDVRGKNHHMYNQHQLDAFHQKRVWCSVCRQGFTRHYNLKVHMFKTHGKEFLEKNFSPDDLVAITSPLPIPKPTPTSFQTAKPNVPGQNSQNTCVVCTKKFSRKTYLYRHLDDFHGITLHGCQSCDDKFLEESQLRDHSREVHSRRQPGPASKTNPVLENWPTKVANITMRCRNCELSFAEQRSYISHMRVFHKKMVDLDKSHDCYNIMDDSDEEEENGTSNPLNKIIKNLMAGAEPKSIRTSTGGSEQCNFCENFYNSSAELKDHVINRHIKDYGFTCDYCSKGFPTLESMTSHTKVKHPNLVGKNQQDQHQPKGSQLGISKVDGNASSLNSLNLTNTTSHDKVTKETISCPICGMKLSRKSNMKIHLRTHSGDRPYTCIICPSSFKQKAHLLKHFRSSHNNKDPPFDCAKCVYRTNSSNDLYHHIEHIHHDKKVTLIKPGPASHKQKQQETIDNTEVLIREQRFEPIKDVLLFEDQIIYPCYVSIPFVSEEDIMASSRKNTTVNEDQDDEDYELFIDESYSDEEEQITSPPQMKKNDVGMLNLSSGVGFNPALSDFCLPMRKAENIGAMKTLKQLELGEKVDKMKKYNGTPMVQTKSLPPMPQLPQIPLPPQSVLTNNNNSSLKRSSNTLNPIGMLPTKKQKKSKFPNKNLQEENAAIQAYEALLHDKLWPVECKKCRLMLSGLETFNKHMNDHWSEDKCCAVCGLFINSKRFNFKKHLTIHTGEKPFVCHICKRLFRQKSHMSKHVRTHRLG